jgi:hypothetical protein
VSERIDRIELPHPLQVEAYRRMTSVERLAAGFGATEFVRERLRARFRGLHPEWPAAQVEAAVARRIHGQPE